MWTICYWIVAFLCLFGLPGISIIMVLLYPVLLVGHSIIFGSIEAAQNRREAREAAKQSYDPQGAEQPTDEDVKPSLDPALLRKRSEESFELIRLQEVEAAEAQAPSEQSFDRHHEVTTSAIADDHSSWQDRLEAEARR